MNNNVANTTSFVALGSGELGLIRVIGPGTCKESGRFENLLRQMEVRGFRMLVVDLSECPRMDSTFAGALLRLANRTVQREAAGRPPLRVAVAGAREPVSTLLETLYLGQIFERVDLPDYGELSGVAFEDRDLSRDEILELSLDSHEQLSALSEENRQRFVHVLKLLRQQLDESRRALGQGASGGV